MFVLVMNHKSQEPELLFSAPKRSDALEWLKTEVLEKDRDWLYAVQYDMWYHRGTLQTIRIQ